MPIVTTDFFSTPRPQGGGVDIGFHEYSATNNTNIASFTYNTPVNVDELKTFTSNSNTVNPILTYSWDLDLGGGFSNVGAANSLNYTFTTAGIFRLKLTVTTVDGTFSTTKDIIVSDVGSYGCTNNVLNNSTFDTDTTNWAKGGADVSFVWNPIGAVDVTINALNVANRFYQEFTLPVDWVIGKEIAVSFDAVSDTAGKRIELELHDVDAAGPKIANDLFFDLTTSVETYTGVFTLTKTPGGPNVHFRFAFKTADTNLQTVTIDNVCLGEYTLGTITACIDPFTVNNATPVNITFDSSCSTASGAIDAYFWEIPGHYSSNENEQGFTFSIDKCGTYDILLTISGQDGTSTDTDQFIVTGCSDPIGNLIDEPNFENELGGSWQFNITGNNSSTIDTQYSSGFFINNYSDNSGNIIVQTTLALNEFTEYALSFKGYAPFAAEGDINIIVRDATNNILLTDLLSLTKQQYDQFSSSFSTLANTTITVQFLLNNITAAHIYEVVLLEGNQTNITTLPNTANKYSLDSNGNVTLNAGGNSTLMTFFELAPTINYLNYLLFTYNIFTGLGQIIEPITGQVLLFNIDTGNFVIYSNIVAGEILKVGTSLVLQKYGQIHPVLPESLLINRGENYWDWYQNEQNTLYGTPILGWPTIFELQYQKAQSL